MRKWQLILLTTKECESFGKNKKNPKKTTQDFYNETNVLHKIQMFITRQRPGHIVTKKMTIIPIMRDRGFLANDKSSYILVFPLPGWKLRYPLTKLFTLLDSILFRTGLGFCHFFLILHRNAHWKIDLLRCWTTEWGHLWRCSLQ